MLRTIEQEIMKNYGHKGRMYSSLASFSLDRPLYINSPDDLNKAEIIHLNWKKLNLNYFMRTYESARAYHMFRERVISPDSKRSSIHSQNFTSLDILSLNLCGII